MNRARTDALPCSLAVGLIDIDNFKEINDTFGHERGDRVLSGLGALLRDSLRGSDVIARVGGEEFVLLKGGKGGFGNTRFKSSVTRAPRKTGPGEPGEIGEFRLELKSMADVGLVGYPNVGKSSILNSLKRSRAVGVSPRPGFTTTLQEVVLDRSIRLVDSPGVVFDDDDGAGPVPDDLPRVLSISPRFRDNAPELYESYYNVSDISVANGSLLKF